MNDSQTAMSRQILLRLLVAVVLLAGVAILNSAYLYRLYFSDQLTVVGWIVNGAILVLFAIGLFRITTLLMRYAGEESALRKFIIHIEDGHQDVLKGINDKSLIGRRYAAVSLLHERHASINHAALASAMLATESTRLSFPRFVHNVLILMGVLGTIISLSIALLNVFQQNLTNGLGFIAVALVYFGGWRPLGVLFGSLLFSLVSSLQVWVQVIGIPIPSDIAVMLPYIMTIVVLVLSAGRVRQPSALTKPYERAG